MRRIKALIVCITIITAYLGMNICENALSEKKPEKYVSQAVEVTGTTAPTATSTPTSEPTSIPALDDTFMAKPIVEKVPKASHVFNNKYGKIDIPEIEVAGINDAEDPVPVVKRTPAELNNNTTNVQAVRDSAYNKLNANITGDYEIKTRVGIDVSSWNEKIDWKKVADSGVEFAMLRIGYRGSVYGKIVLDHYFYDNIEGALANGIDVGIYFYSQAINVEEAVQEAAWVCDIIKNYNITYPVAYDLEEVEINRIATVSFEQLNRNAVAFLDYVASKGYTPCMYGCKSYLEYVWDMKLYKNCYVWVAHVGVSQTTYQGRYDMWQYSWTGRIPGIPENVDMNIEYIKVPKNQVAEAPPKDTKEETTSPPEAEESDEDTTLSEEQVQTEPVFTETNDLVVAIEDVSLYLEADATQEPASTALAEAVLRRIGSYDNGYSLVEIENNQFYVLTEKLTAALAEEEQEISEEN